MFDLIIKGGRVVDGSGRAAFNADVAIDGGTIVALGALGTDARTVVDASDRVVAPGFIDPHTHFDVQLLWDGAARPAIEHGITSIVPGNCSLSLAPLKAADRRALVGMFQQIEELPPAAFTEAFEWTWERFGGYVEALKRNLAINVAPLVGHSVIRLWVMGADSQKRSARPDEISAMQTLLRECLDAGAVGLSTSFVDVDQQLRPVPSRFAYREELDALARVLGEYGRMLQVVPEFYATDLTIARIDQLAELSLKYGIPTTFSPLFDSAQTPDNVPRTMARVEEQFARGARVWPQVQTRPIDISFSFEHPSLYFGRFPSWYRVMRLSRAERIAALRDPATVERMIDETGADGGRAFMGKLVVRGGEGAPESLAGRTLEAIADDRGEGVAQSLINVSLENDLMVPFLAASVGHQDASRVGPLLAHPLVHVGASDGGAHVTSFATYGDTGYLFSRYVRETHHLSLEQAVKKITADTAQIWGLPKRGLLQKGYAADVVVFDAQRIARGDEHATFDMPGRGMRYVRDGVGIDTVIVNGAIAYADGAYTDSRSGSICT
jgi:N-acyl-D-aspartate/D-glutamate deacylase